MIKTLIIVGDIISIIFDFKNSIYSQIQIVHKDFIIKNYTDNFLVKSSTYFLNCLSVVERLSTVLHA